MSSHPPLLQVQQAGRLIRKKWLWRGVSFDLFRGDRVGLVGPSGTGKSLLLRSLIGLDPLDEGQVSIQGRSLSQWDPPRLRRDFLYLAQSPGLLEGTVEDNLRAIFQFKLYRDRTYSRDAAMSLFQKMGRGEAFLDQSAERLSGGERQILNVVRGLLAQPQVLLLDEPTAALDMDATAQVEGLLDQWFQSHDHFAYMWISHSPDQIERMTQTQLDLSDFAV